MIPNESPPYYDFANRKETRTLCRATNNTSHYSALACRFEAQPAAKHNVEYGVQMSTVYYLRYTEQPQQNSRHGIFLRILDHLVQGYPEGNIVKVISVQMWRVL